MLSASKDDKRRGHPYLSGNFAPVQQCLPLTPCSYTGTIPEELAGGEYVRNGGNPVTNEALGREAHWFDGDGMLSGVLFRRIGEKGRVQPEFVNQYILTDVYLSSKTSPFLKTPILPSIATLVNPMSSLLTIVLRILRTILLVVLSHLPGSQAVIKRISVANTAVYYHDGRALATCESGPPMRFVLPGLETIGWYNGKECEGEAKSDRSPGFGGRGLMSFMKEWTTAHPRVDPQTAELLLYHSTFVPPYVHYSIVPSMDDSFEGIDAQTSTSMLNVPIPGISSPKMMHDFGVSRTHTIIMDLPLSLNPLNLAKNKPVVAYDPTSRSRFGIFPRYQPEDICWYETNPCCIFHTANAWNTTVIKRSARPTSTKMLNLLVCRLTSASLVFSAGNLAAPTPTKEIPAHLQEEDQCRLYYYQFRLPAFALSELEKSSYPIPQHKIEHQWSLSAIPFEFPTLRDDVTMGAARYIYGCSVSGTSFGAALGRAVKINALVKMDVKTLIAKGIRRPPTQITGCVDTRTITEIMASNDPTDPIKVFKMPDRWYAQESRFVPRIRGVSEDDGFILTFVFDESQLDDEGECKMDATSELWIIDAKNMVDVVAKLSLPQRVPYGLHGNWFSEEDVQGQRPVEGLRKLLEGESKMKKDIPSVGWKVWMGVREGVEEWIWQ